MLLPNVKRVLPWIRVTPELPPQRSKQTRSGSQLELEPLHHLDSHSGGGGVHVVYCMSESSL